MPVDNKIFMSEDVMTVTYSDVYHSKSKLKNYPL